MFITITTIGYGDFKPLTPAGQMFVVLFMSFTFVVIPKQIADKTDKSSLFTTLLLASFLTGEERVRARMTMGHQYMGVTEAMGVGEVRGSLDATPESLAR